MAPPRRRTDQRVSYREPTSDDDEEDQDDSFTESGDEATEPLPNRAKSRAKSKASRPSRARVASRTRSQPRKSYAEEFSDDDDGDGEFSDDERMELDEDVPVRKQLSKPGRASGRPPRAQRSTASPQKHAARGEQHTSSPVRRRPAVVPSPAKHIGPSQQDLWFMGKPCPWTTLPFEILRDILSYASCPLFDGRSNSSPNVAWLLKFRNIDPALLDASLAVLYYCPPITSSVAAHNISALIAHSKTRTTNYNAKVKHLKLEVRSTLAYSAGPDLGSVDLGTLVKNLPQLSGIDIWSILDNSDARRVALASKTWSYPDSLFNALKGGEHRLRQFHWNSRFLAKLATVPTELYQWMHKLHLTPAFQTLKYIKFTGFLGDSDVREDLYFPIGFSSPTKTLTRTLQNKETARLEKKQELRRQDELLAGALNALPNLRKVDFHMCSIVDGEWLQLLPRTLTHLGILECDRLDSDGLQEFLESHGTHLRALVLNYNPALSIAFLTTLRSDCPVLEELEIDLTNYRKLTIVDGTEGATYESLLPNEHPTWPSTLQSIEMNHLRQWSSSAAEGLFKSLIDSAKELPNLRSLQLSVSLDISWRERAKMRDRWEEKFKRVFLRNDAPPNTDWWSIRAFKSWKDKQNVVVLVPRVSTSAIATPFETSDSEVPNTRGKRSAPDSGPSRRLRRRIVDSGPSGSLADMVTMTLESHIQGMCTKVDVRIDNLRPMEQQFDEGDFLDSAPSGDDEWDEDKGDLDEEELFLRKKGRRRRKYAW